MIDIQETVSSLHRRIMDETEKILAEQFKALGIENPKEQCIGKCTRLDYPPDVFELCSYFFNDIHLLTVKPSPQYKGIEFYIPNLKGETSNAH